jgi:hypothetical protein
MEIRAYGPQKTNRVRLFKEFDEPRPSVETVGFLQEMFAAHVLAYKMAQFASYPR